MLKKLIYILLGVTAILLVTYFARYKQASNFTNRIPATATAVININTRQLEHHLLVDLLTHPSSYIDFTPSIEEDSVEEESFSLTKGISIPKNVLLFTDGNTLGSAWYSSIFELDDETELSRFLVSEKFNKEQHDSINLYKKGILIFGIKNNKLIICFNANGKKETIKKLNTYFNETIFLQTTSSLLKSLDNKSDISYTTLKKDFLIANFQKGKLKIGGDFNPGFDLFKTNSQPVFFKNSIASISGTFNKKSSHFKKLLKTSDLRKFEEFTHLSADSIISKWNGDFSITLKSIEPKTDSIITYNYDDDFNKVEVISTQEIIIPDMNISLGKVPENSLFNYFQQKKAIKIVGIDSIFAAIPLYGFLASDKDKTLEIYTISTSEYQKRQSTKLSGKFNLEAYLQNPLDIPLLPVDSTYENFIRDILLELSDKNEFHLEINALDSERSFLGQLIK